MDSFKTNVNETGKITRFNTATRNKSSTMNFYGGCVEGIVNFDTRGATFTFYTFIFIASLYMIYNAKLAFLTLLFPRSIDVVAWPVQRKFSRCRQVQKSCNEHRDPFKNASLANGY